MLLRCILLILISALSVSCSDNQEACNDQAPPITILGRSVAPIDHQPDENLQLEIEPFASCKAIEESLLPRLEEMATNSNTYGGHYGAYGSVCPVPGGSRNSTDMGTSEPIASLPEHGGVTNLQEAAVDEGDMVKVTDSLIFVAKPGHIEILGRSDLNLRGRIETPDLKRTSLLAFQKTLLVMGMASSDDNTSTQFSFYETNGLEIPKLKNDFLVRGEISSTRLMNGRLIVVTKKNMVPIVYGQSKEQLQASLRQHLDGVDCTSIYKPLTTGMDTQMSTVHQFDLNAGGVVYARKSILGNFSETYMSPSHLYLTKKDIYIQSPGAEPAEATAPGGFVSPGPSPQSFRVNALTRWTFSGPTPQLEAVGAFEGKTIGPWAYKELKGGEISVATTTRRQGSEQTNHLFVLDAEASQPHLKVVGQVTDFGRTENIRSVRYIDETAYVVTFKKTDPLFVIDLADPLTPTILSELKAPGFSRYMHPVLGSKLIGLGYAADDQGSFAYFQGVQLSLFDVEDPLAPSTVTQLEIGDRGSFSDVLFNHQAFYHNPETNLVGFPIVRVKALSSDPWAYKTHEFTGAQFYRVHNGGFEALENTSHSDLIDSQCQFQDPSSFWWNTPRVSLDINRIFNLDNRLLAVSRFGLTQHDPEQPGQALKTVTFQNSSMDCVLE